MISIRKDKSMKISFNTFKFVWIPRIIIITFVALFSMFSLDAFDGNGPILDQLAMFLIHMIPSFVMILVLIASWNRSVIAGIMFMALGIVFTFYFSTYRQAAAFFTISLIPFLTGMIFLLPTLLRKRASQYSENG